uniref:Uncharacterized protein n=1 Tax=Heterorhabditis bacteriophora TaxID=37862 RepID=A0A1I7WY28_HETBA
MPPPGSRFLAAQLSSLRLVEPSPFPFLPHSHIPNSTSSFRFWESQLFRVESSRIQRLLQAPRSFSNMNQFPLSGHGGSRRGAISEGMDLGGGASQTSNEKERQKGLSATHINHLNKKRNFFCTVREALCVILLWPFPNYNWTLIHAQVEWYSDGDDNCNKGTKREI